MIVSKLIGGLGNQMFQFASGFNLANRLNMQYRIDIKLLNKYDRHNGYQLDEIFDFNFEIANYSELWGILKFKTFSVINESVEKVDPYFFDSSNHIFREYSHNFINDIERINSKCYISGYWQSEKYFLNSENELRKIFTFKNSLSGINKDIQSDIFNSNSVCIHVRRGDYLSNPDAAKFHGSCELEYYKKSIDLISSKISNPKYFIFSDDVEFIRNNFNFLNNYKVIDNNQGRDSFIDLRLMSLCKHHIIANSTFSWWGAWLAKNDQQIVIAPEKWFIGSSEIIKDIYCQNWIKL